MTKTRASSALAPLLVFVAAALFFFAGTTERGLWTTGEHRYAEVARVLTAEGNDHLVPHLNGELYPDKPPLFFWVAGAPHRLLGLDLEIAARIPSILGGAFTVMLTFLLGRRWYGTAAGFAAAGALATTDLFGWASRMAHMDAFLTAVIASSLYCYVRADATPREERASRSLWTALGFLAVGAGILVKGPPAPAVPGITILVFLLWTAPREILTPRLAWGVVLTILPGAVWAYAAAQDAGWKYMDALVRGHAIGHAAGDVDKQQPWHYYLWNVPVHLLPWAVFLPAAVHAALARGREAERRADRFLVAWLVAPWVLFSFSVAKRDLYMVPIHPAAALLVGRLVRDATERPETLRDAAANWPRRLFAAAAVAAGCAVVAAAVLLLTGIDRTLVETITSGAGGKVGRFGERYERLRSEFTGGHVALAAALGGAMAWGGLVAWRARTAPVAGAGLLAAAAALQIVDATVLWPSRDADESPREFLVSVRTTIGDAPLLRLGTDGGLQYVVNWALLRDAVPETTSAKRAREFLAADDTAARYVVTDANQVRNFGEVSGAVEILRVARRRNPDLLLLGNPAAAKR